MAARHLFPVAALVFATGAALPPAQEPAMHAAGSFEVTITPEAQADAPEGGMPTSRMAMVKRFSGGMSGTAIGTMISAGMPAPGQSAAYVAIDQFNGTVDGRSGGFTLLHRGTMTAAGEGTLSVVIAPDSGTGALAGITGTLAIELRDGGHFYDLEYRLPAAD